MTSAASNADDVRVIPTWDLSDRITKALREVNLRPGQLADIMAVDPTTVSRWLKGHTKPGKAVLIVISDLTGVDLHWLEHGPDCTVRGCRDSNPKPSDP